MKTVKILIVCLTLIAIASSFAIAGEKIQSHTLAITFWKCQTKSEIIIAISPMKPSDWDTNYFTSKHVVGEIFLEYDGSRIPWRDNGIFGSFLKGRAKQLEANYIQVEEFASEKTIDR